MVKDAKITSTDYVEFVVKNIANEKSDSIFEKQFDLLSAAIGTYTPRSHRQELNERIFDLLLKLIKETGA